MLENRNDLLEIKKAEIVSIIERTNISLREEEKISSKDIMQSFLKSGGLLITPPQQDPPMMHMLIIDSLSNYNKGESIKPGNVKLNIRHLIESLPEVSNHQFNWWFVISPPKGYITARPKGRYRKRYYWSAIKRYYLNLLFLIPLLALLYIFEPLHL